MFTGLIRAVGTARSHGSNALQIHCGAHGASLLEDIELGDSIAVDGICLTVTEILPNGFTADVSPETLSRTTLSHNSEIAYVNLEPSLKVGSKIGGHFVSGHIDGVGYLESSVQTDNAWEMSFRVEEAQVARYIVSKGSIAINGVSLTVATCDASGAWFKVAVIPLTYAETNLRYLQPGSRVNLEGDMLGKYVEKFLRLGTNHSLAIAGLEEMLNPGHQDSITPAFLAENGYL
ncbi:MAG TPA: riboflavin synthase [Coleofasciculaceae cyanobacterium]